jgi:nitronate monooxygenase
VSATRASSSSCSCAAAARGDLDVIPVWAGEALDLITTVGSAADIVADLAAEAERALASAGNG